jgi:hypothetical protein
MSVRTGDMNVRFSQQCSLCHRFNVKERRRPSLTLAAGKGFGKVQEKEVAKVRVAPVIIQA